MFKQKTDLLRSKIIALYELGWSNTKIALYLKINIKTVSLWISRYSETGTVCEIKKPGRKRKTTKDQDLEIQKLVKTKCSVDNNFITDDIKKELQKINIFLCNNTIIKRMKEYDFYSAFPFKKPYLTEKQKEVRLQWALENYNTNWFKINFSDSRSLMKHK